MRFRGSRKAPAFLGRREQYRILGLILALGLVLLAMRASANPELWRRVLFLDEETDAQNAEDDSAAHSLRGEERRGALREGEFRTANGTATARNGADKKPEDGAKDAGNGVKGSADSDPPMASARRPAVASDGLTIDPAMLAGVEDDTFGIRGEELEAYYGLLARLRETPIEELREAARADVGFQALGDAPAQFRGQLLTLEGRIKKLRRIPAGENEYGLDRLYEAWLFTDDSGLDPYRVVCLEVSAGTPLGEDLDPMLSVRAAGYFFKIQRYATQRNTDHPAPVILAKRVTWLRPAAAAESSALPYVVLGFVLLVAATLGLTLWRISAGDKAFHRGHVKRIIAAPREHIQALEGVETTDTGRMLRDLAAAELDAERAVTEHTPDQGTVEDPGGDGAPRGGRPAVRESAPEPDSPGNRD